MTRSILSRLILLAFGILAVAGAATAMRVNQWSPIDAFLEHRNTTPLVGTTMADSLKPGSTQAANHSPFGAYDPMAVPPAVGFVSGTAGAIEPGRESTSGFGPDRLQGAPSAGGSGESASLGGLWRLMGLARHHDATVSTRVPSTRAAAAPKPPRTSSSRHASGGGNVTAPVVSAANPVGTIAMVTTPAILIGNNAAPVTKLISGATGGGTLSTPGGTKLTVGATGGGMSATPEPPAALLIGTGLLALVLTLRRVRA